MSVISTATNTVTTTIDVGNADPTGVAITPNGLFAYVTNISSNNVSVINATTNTVTTTIPLGNAPPPPYPSGPGTAQTPVNGCVTPPGTKAVRRAGLKHLTRPHCRTNAGQKVTTKVTGQRFKVIRKKNGAVQIGVLVTLLSPDPMARA